MLGVGTENNILPARVGYVLGKDFVESVSLVQSPAENFKITFGGVSDHLFFAALTLCSYFFLVCLIHI